MTPLAAVLLLSLVQLGAGQLEFLHGIPRSRLLSFASGVSISFVFVHLLPHVAASQQMVEAAPGGFSFVERQVWLLALVGLATFHGLELMVLRARRPWRALADGSATGGAMYWLHIAMFASYNALVGFLLVQPIGPGRGDPILFVLALALHFLVNDIGLRTHYKRHFGGLGRWLLVLAPLFGWAMAQRAALSAVGLSVLFSLLAGGMILNTLKEELPDGRQARFWPFLLGGAVYSGLALVF